MSDSSPVSSLLDRPGSVEPPEHSVDGPDLEPPTYLDLPVDLPMLAPEFPVLHSVQRQHSLFGIYEEENKEATAVRRDSHLSEIPVKDAIFALEKTAQKSDSSEVFQDLNSFKNALNLMFKSNTISAEVAEELFTSLGEVDGRVSLSSATTAVILLSKGSVDEKIRAIFTIADTDKDGSLSLEEVFEFFLLIFGNVMSRNLLGLMNANGVPLSAPEQLAAATAKECMEMCDLDRNGCLSLDEFRNWFHRPRRAPLSLP
jgi:Ca2+-binding EF-hand superfamily protein